MQFIYVTADHFKIYQVHANILYWIPYFQFSADMNYFLCEFKQMLSPVGNIVFFLLDLILEQQGKRPLLL